jgi:predicted DNA-binding helix-hairpin-helix protein
MSRTRTQGPSARASPRTPIDAIERLCYDADAVFLTRDPALWGYAMEIEQKIDLLGEAAQYDVCRACGTHSGRMRDDLGRWVYPAVRPDGTRVSLLKVLQTNVCERDCAYCANRSQRDAPRTSFKPEELAATFDRMVRRGLCQGLFLSSGVSDNVARASAQMLATVELVRKRYAFRGYVHLKILPGADDATIEASVRLADRVSVNLEAPNAERLFALSRSKAFATELLASLRQADRIRRKVGPAVSLTTQFVVGAAGETDREILATATALYRDLGLARAYYSAFQPVRDTPLEELSPTPTWREQRLYQVDMLLRRYGYCFDELCFNAQGNLPREADPKQVWAWRHPEFFPVEVNTANREALLRVPGIGPITAQRIISRRRVATLRDLRDLGMGAASARRAAPYILLDGRAPTRQLGLWEGVGEAVAALDAAS